MAPNRITRKLRENDQARVGTLLPYFTAGFPDTQTTSSLIIEADRLGAGVVEIGFPFSDSIADGPVIQESFHYALRRGHRVEDAFRLVAEVRPRVACGLVAMVCYSIVSRIGLDRFMDRAAEAGFDGVILPDVPVEEARVTVAAAGRAGLCHIGLVAPSTSPQRRQAIANASTGFIYQIASAGTTGERGALPPGLGDEVRDLRAVSGLPVCVGFGVSDAEQVRDICRFASGAIVGSAIIRRIDEAVKAGADSTRIVEQIGAFLRSLVVGLSPCG
jgi:tryptophan synthase alpha chain